MTNAEIAQTLETHLRPLTFPVAAKLSPQDQAPPGYRRPREVLGHALNICQGTNFARRYGWNMAFLRQDMACPLSVPIFGFCQDPDFVTRGEHIHPDFTDSLQAAALTQAAQPKAPLGSIASVLLAPLAKADFTPDLILVYGSPAQVVRLVQAALYHQGGSLTSSFSGRCACAQEFIHPWQSGQCNVVIPAQGERLFAMTADDELAFSIPWPQAEQVAAGLAITHQRGVSRVPTPFFGMRMRPRFPPRYAELERHCGIED